GGPLRGRRRGARPRAARAVRARRDRGGAARRTADARRGGGPGPEAPHGLRSVARGRVGSSGEPAALRVDGDPGQGLDSGPHRPLPRLPLAPATSQLVEWSRSGVSRPPPAPVPTALAGRVK